MISGHFDAGQAVMKPALHRKEKSWFFPKPCRVSAEFSAGFFVVEALKDQRQKKLGG